MRSRLHQARPALLAIAVSVALTPAIPETARAEKAAASSERITLEQIAEGFQAVERWQIDEARELAERAYREMPDHPLTLALIGEVKLHMSDYRGAAEFFKQAKDAGAPEEILGSEMLADRARIATDGYEEAIGEHFIIRYTPGKDAILLPYAFDTLNQARDRIGDLLGWKPTSRIVVEIYPNAGTLASVSTLTKKEIETSGTIALCKWNRLMVTTPRAIVFGYSWRDTIAHELTHLIVGSASNNTVPIWLHEGIAKFAETAWRGEPGDGLSVEQQTMLRDAARKGKLIPFERMHPSMAKLKSQEETALAFAEVFTFIEYLVAHKGWEGMRQVLQLMRSGIPEEQAIETVHGKSLKALSQDWMKTLKTREIRQGRGVAGTTRPLEVKARADAPDDQLHGVNKKGRRFARAADLLYSRGRIKAAQKELEKAYKETGSPMISAKLAMVALATGDWDAAETAAKQAIEGTPDLAGPNITLAEILIHRGKKAEARAALDQAIGVNPFDPRIYALLAQAGEDQKKIDAAGHALSIMRSEKPGPRSFGAGGLVTIDATPFSRVYVVKKDEGDREVMFPTGMVTPSAPIEMKPGIYRLRLVPPRGGEISRSITVVEKAADGTPQRIAPDTTGS